MGILTRFTSKKDVRLFLNICLALSVILILCIVTYPFFKIRTPDKHIDLDGKWQISYTDSFEHLTLDDVASNWDDIILPGKFITQAINKTGEPKGICWIRKSFYVSSIPDKTGLLLGRIANADQAWVNGVMIGSTGGFPPNEFAMWNYPRAYYVPENVIRQNSLNHVVVRISYNQTGEVLGTLGVVDYTSFLSFSSVNHFFQITLCYIAISIGIVFFFLFGLFYMHYRGSEEYLYYCLQLAAGLPIILELCIQWNIYPTHSFRIKFLGFAWVAANVVHPIFLHRLYNIKRPLIERGLCVYLSISIVACLMLSNDLYIRFASIILIILTWFLGFYNISCHVTALIKNKPYAKAFGFFGIAVVVFSMHDGFLYLLKFSDLAPPLFNKGLSIMLFHIGALMLYSGTSLVLVYRFFDFSSKMEALNSSLENYILENSFLLEELNHTKIGGALQKQTTKEMKLSTKAEEKIRKVLRMIDENYNEGLDRQLLADSVGVHPDNLSKQFKTYTGKKLGDYIYEIRISEACRRLCDSEANIIDIAFAVGFESLRTFNRVFPKITGTTPDKYRKENR